MSGGYFLVDRALWRLREPGRFTTFEARVWLLSEAAHSPHTRRLDGLEVALERGQLAASSSFLASKWGWSRSAVRRFIDRLEAEGVLSRDAARGISVITIVGYDENQSFAKSAAKTGHPTGHPIGHPPDDASRCKNNNNQPDDFATGHPTGHGAGRKDNTGIISKGGISASRASAREAAPLSEKFRHDLLATLGADPGSGLVGRTGNRLGTRWDWQQAEEWRALGLTEGDILTVVQAAMDRPGQKQPGSFKYFSGAMRDYAATGQLPQARGLNHDRSPRPTGADVAEAADRVLAAWGQR